MPDSPDVDEGREQEVTREELLNLGGWNVILNMRGDRDVRMEDLVRLRCDLRRYLSRQFQQLTSYFDGEVGNPLRQEPWP
ncbi:Voltage-dependent T-type calcium channel subunit alpha-1H [Durusdinium trenchii]|uniref:Voltage-dependent T-type calcium channel subunit alpha-1H n=1 Tax=Durusdinium trenchii TaxID=1381693 RepID=A0ABP0L4S8_9DINO